MGNGAELIQARQPPSEQGWIPDWGLTQPQSITDVSLTTGDTVRTLLSTTSLTRAVIPG